MDNRTLKEWDRYLAGKSYNGKLEPSYYETVDLNLEFFNGNQWRNLKSHGMPTPVFNILKRGVTFFVSSLMSSKTKIQYTTLKNRDDLEPKLNLAEIATSEVENLFEKFNMDTRIRDALFDAAVMGDVAAHLYFNPDKNPYGGKLDENVKGEIQFELVDGTNIYFGNANNPILSTETQPYIIISGRDTVENLKREAEGHQGDDDIKEDTNKDDMAGFKEEVEIEGDKGGKAKYIIYYYYDKDTQTVKATKCTEKAYIYKDIDTGLSRYPVAWMVWEKQKNQYHGRAVTTGMIPNQIFINRMFAMVMYHLMMAAFPKAVYDADKVQGWTNEIGTAIPISGLAPGESIKNIAGYLEPGTMSSQIVQVLELAIQYTKETLGINDAMMGNVDPNKASGKSIVATVNQAVVPLENVKANLYEWLENIGEILLDMMCCYYGERPMLVNTKEGKEMQYFDFKELRDIWLSTKCDVGPTSYWSELASVETLDNLFNKGALDVIEYLESIPDGYISNKQDLMDKIRTRMQNAMPMMEEIQPEGVAPGMENIIDGGIQ